MNLQHLGQYIIYFFQMMDSWKVEVGSINGQLYIISFKRILEIIFMADLMRRGIALILGLDNSVERE